MAHVFYKYSKAPRKNYLYILADAALELSIKARDIAMIWLRRNRGTLPYLGEKATRNSGVQTLTQTPDISPSLNSEASPSLCPPFPKYVPPV